jgi:CHAT domain-containing protein
MPKLLVEELPRIWWIGTGVAAFLPFHAAGDHNPGSIENTLSRAVSSYAPTIKALLFAREREVSAMRDSDPEALKLLIVTMPTTPGEKNLPGVTLEKAHIQNAAEGNFWVQSLTQPSVAKVLQTMKKADVVHFACHGVSDWIDPSKSHLLLQKDSKLDPLLIQDLLESEEARARIVYLSACSTAVDNSEVTDEAMHFASCFQAVGIPHVIGSLWPQSDAVSVEIAQSFYNHLGEREGTQASVSLALHRAILQVRKSKHRQPAAWAGYIHLGC